MPANVVRHEETQEMFALRVRVVAPDGRAVVGAEVIPWAIRSSQGHGLWRPDGFGATPPRLQTDAEGMVNVPYPRFTQADERVATSAVSVSVDHDDFAFANTSVAVPQEGADVAVVALNRGARLDVIPVEKGERVSLQNVYAVWSDARSWKRDRPLERTDDGALRLPIMPAGKGAILLIRLDGQRATHFGRLPEIELDEGAHVRQCVEMRPAVTIKGVLSDHVPRPVRNGRVKVQTLPADPRTPSASWFTWAPIAEDGTFVIDSWPGEEPIQMIALGDGFVGESGEAPANCRSEYSTSFLRPQCFLADEVRQPILLRMRPMARCEIQVADCNGRPLSDVHVSAYPNVQWWNLGSQVYCTPLVRGERFLAERDYDHAIDRSYPPPFEATTNASGVTHIDMPAGSQSFYAMHDDFELPIVRGRRGRRVEIAAGDSPTVRLTLQPKGTELLGEWDRVAVLLFSCSTARGRTLLQNAEFREKITSLREQWDEAADAAEPSFVAAVYRSLADAFAVIGDFEEAGKWGAKADALL